jgi:hypothetical protein
MTVAELRKALEEFPGDVTIAIYSDGRIWRAESIFPQKGWLDSLWLNKSSKDEDNEPLAVLS